MTQALIDIGRSAAQAPTTDANRPCTAIRIVTGFAKPRAPGDTGSWMPREMFSFR